MKTIKLSLAGLFLVLCAAYFLQSSTHDDSENLFQSGHYRDYLKAWDRSLALDKRTDHEAYIQGLRQEPENPQIHALYIAKDINSAWRNYLSEVTKTRIDSIDQLPALQQEFKKDPRFTSLHHPADFEDQMLAANLPSWIADYNGTSVIRMAQPVCGNNGWRAMASVLYVAPEFRQFLRAQKSHLYVNLMKRKGNEGLFSQKIELLEKDLPNVYVVTIDRNSKFYNQDDVDSVEKSIFKKAFLEHMQGPDYYWSGKLGEEWTRQLQNVLQMVDESYFSDRPVLSSADRRKFIELSHLAILDALQAKIKPESMNITCRQAIDRGPSLTALWLYKNGVFNLEQATVHLFVPPLLFHNRAPHAARIERFVSAFNQI